MASIRNFSSKCLLFLFFSLMVGSLFSCQKKANATEAGSTAVSQSLATVRDFDKPFYNIARMPLTDEEKAAKLLTQMEPEEIVGQLFMFGYSGKIADAEILNWINPNGIGNVKIFGWNGTDLEEVCTSVQKMQKAALATRLGIPLFVATDQEGGWVRHIKAETSITPGNMAIGASPYYEDSYLSSFYIAKELSLLGINMNFAPTVDIYLDKESSIIGSRAFSSDPLLTGNLSIAFLQGHEAFKVVSTAKHFPGHGNSKEDSHGRLPQIHSSLEFIKENDLVPYKMLIKEQLPAIMSGHISFPNITHNNEPATLSQTLITDLLRGQLGYNGIVITDDLNMAGMRKEGVETSNKSLEALKAGNDMVLISKQNYSPRQYQIQRQNVLNEYEANKAFRELVHQSCLRILKTKFHYLAETDSVPLFPDIEKAKKSIPSPEAKAFFFNQSCRSVTRFTPGKENLSKDDSVFLAGYYIDFFAVGKKYFPNNRRFNSYAALNEASPSTVARQIFKMLKKDEKVIVSVMDKRTCNLAKALMAFGAPVYVISTLMPGYALELTEAKMGLAIYSTTEDSFTAAFAALQGEFEPIGKLPFK